MMHIADSDPGKLYRILEYKRLFLKKGISQGLFS